MGSEATDSNEAVVLDGGPMDGQEHRAEPAVDELAVVMTDGQQHRYERSSVSQTLPDGRTVCVFVWSGRYYGPR